MVDILMMSAKLATLGLFTIKVFQNKGYGVIFFSIMSPTKFYHVTQIIRQMCSCNQGLVTLAFLERSYHNFKIFFEESYWFKFNNSRLALGMALNFTPA